MNISLDQQIRKDKQREQATRTHYNRTYNPNSNPYNKSRYHQDRNSRYGYQNNRERQRERQLRVYLYISNLHYSVTREQLQEICQKFGRVKSCRIQWDKMGRSNEKATVEYFNKADSENAVQKLKGTIFEDQAIEVQLIEEQHNTHKKHEIRKNYNHRFKQFSNNTKNGYRSK